jgi:signal transduction histidine kinase
MDRSFNRAGYVDAISADTFDTSDRMNRRFTALGILLDFSLASHKPWQKSELFYAASRTAMQMSGAQVCYLYFRQRADPTSERLGQSIYYRLDQVIDDGSSDRASDSLRPLPQSLIVSVADRQDVTRQANNCHLLVPIHRDGKMMALLDMVHSDDTHFDEIDVELMAQLVQQLDVALQNEYVIAARTAQVELAQYLSAELDLAVLLNQVASSAAKIANAQGSSILLIQPQQGNTMRFAAVHGLSERDQDVLRQLVVPLHGSMAGSVVLTGEPLISNDVAVDPRFYAGVSNTAEMKTRSLLAVPMLAQDKAIGALEVINQRYDDGFNHADAEMLTIFAAQAAIAIQNARLLAERQTSLTELTKLEQRKSQFIALVSHELRTPLNLISGYLSLLRSSLPGAVGAEHEVMEFLSHVDQATSTLTGMVNNITSLYNLETGNTQLLLAKHDVILIIKDVVAKHRDWALTKGICFRCNFPDHPLYATCDGIEVNRILGNLLNNALKFTPEGGQITISAGNTPVVPTTDSVPTDRREDVKISVADTGPGIKEEQLEIVFERFSQLGSHLTRTQSGIGLGLPLAKGLAEKHGGQLWAEIRPGEGALFHFTLPAVE